MLRIPWISAFFLLAALRIALGFGPMRLAQRKKGNASTVFGYLDSLSKDTRSDGGCGGRNTVDMTSPNHEDNKFLFAGGETGVGPVCPHQYGQTNAQYSDQESPSRHTLSWMQNQSIGYQQQQIRIQNHPFQYDPTAPPPPASSQDEGQPHDLQQAPSARSFARLSSIQALEDMNAPNTLFYKIGKDALKEGTGGRRPSPHTAAHFRKSSVFDFEQEIDKQLNFASQRIGHDRLEPIDRPTQRFKVEKSEVNRMSRESIMEERKSSSMFQSINQANMMKARATTESRNIGMGHLNDVLSSPSPFRFLGQPNPNFQDSAMKASGKPAGKDEKMT